MQNKTTPVPNDLLQAILNNLLEQPAKFSLGLIDALRQILPKAEEPKVEAVDSAEAK